MQIKGIGYYFWQKSFNIRNTNFYKVNLNNNIVGYFNFAPFTFKFIDTNGVNVEARPKRNYPYNDVACQTIGWVGLSGAKDAKLFSDDPLLRYLPDELCGRDGSEYVCEALLRGRRGQILYNLDTEVIAREQTQFGKNVRLSLKQESIELRLELSVI